MTNDPFYTRMLETSWRRQLTAAEQAELSSFLQAHPDCKADWEYHAALTQQLKVLKEPDLSSNFTSRVLQQIALPEKASARRPSWRTWILRFATPLAATAIVVFTLHHQQVEHRKELLESVVVVSDVKSLPNVEVLKNFDAIREMSTTPGPDEQLISLLQ